MSSRTQALEHRPEAVWAQAGAWRDLHEAGKPLTNAQAVALREAYFRVGVHPDTLPAEALTLLDRAQRMDAANPRYPYHIGLIHLRRGQLEVALEWLQAAARLSPVNHRIWAHISRAHRELAKPQGTEGYDRRHAAEAKRIAEGIRDGRDHFGKPGEPEVLPLVRPGTCRWNGIQDLEIDAQLRESTKESTRDALYGELEAMASGADQPGVAGAFTVLAVQWLVYGYPVAAVRRLESKLPPGPAARLLAQVCVLFEAELADLPALLAEALAEQAVPDVLVALIHRRRLLWRPLAFKDLGGIDAARAFAEGDPARHESTLAAAWQALDTPPPKQLPDAPPRLADRPAASSPDALLAELEQAAELINGLMEAAVAFAKKTAKARKEIPDDRLRGDLRLLTDFVQSWEERRLGCLARLQQLQTTGPSAAVMPFAEYQHRVLECQSSLQASPGILRKILAKDLRITPDGPAAPSPEVQDLSDRLDAVPDSAPEPAPPTRQPATAARPERPAPAPAGASERERVRHALYEAEQLLDANFAEAWQTLDVYGTPELRRRGAAVVLRGYVGGLQAESDQRLGRSTAARRRWNAMLADDPLHPGVLRNLAVAHTSAGNLDAATRAWQRDLEARYVRDLLDGDLRRGAGERAAAHLVFAGSFGTAALCAALVPDVEREEKRNEQIGRQIPYIVASRAKVAAATAHLRLEELNHILTLQSPTLLLGVPRIVTETELGEALKRRKSLVESAAEHLPPRVRGAFAEACERLFEETHKDASEAKNRLARPGDAQEEKAHTDWAKRRALWKFGIRNAIADEKADWALTDFSGDVIGNLRLIDALPLDVKDARQRAAVEQLTGRRDPTRTLANLNGLTDLAANFAIGRVFAAARAADSDQDAQEFRRRYQGVSRSWAGNPIPEKIDKALDDASMLYGPAVIEAFDVLNATRQKPDAEQHAVIANAIPELERWVARLPGATGPAVTLVSLLSILGYHNKAMEVLTQTASAINGGHRLPLYLVRPPLGHVYATAAQRIRPLLEVETEEKPARRLQTLLVTAYRNWIGYDEDAPDPAEIAAALARWTDDKIVATRRRLETDAVLARFDRGEAASPEALHSAMLNVISRDPQNYEALYHLIGTSVQRLKALRSRLQRTIGTTREQVRRKFDAARAECIGRCEDLLPHLEGARREEVKKLLETLRPDPAKSPRE